MAFRRAGAGKRRGGGDYGDGQKRQRTMASLLTPEDKLGMPLETIIGAWRALVVLWCMGLDWWVGGRICRRRAADRIRRGSRLLWAQSTYTDLT